MVECCSSNQWLTTLATVLGHYTAALLVVVSFVMVVMRRPVLKSLTSVV